MYEKIYVLYARYFMCLDPYCVLNSIAVTNNEVPEMILEVQTLNCNFYNNMNDWTFFHYII